MKVELELVDFHLSSSLNFQGYSLGITLEITKVHVVNRRYLPLDNTDMVHNSSPKATKFKVEHRVYVILALKVFVIS